MKQKFPKLIDMVCPKCGRATHHYLNSETGEYRCVRCQSVNKTVKVDPHKEVTFEMDEELDKALNPVEEETPQVPAEEETPVEELLQNAGTEKAEGPVFDDQGNPV